MKILHLEDNANDALLVRRLLAKDWPDCTITVVTERDPFLKALAEERHDIVLSDFQLPSFNGIEALKLARARAPETPFIFFSGTIGEERAIEAVRSGAADYVIKDRMNRLPISIQRAMHDSAERRTRRNLEESLAQEQDLLRLLMENLPDDVYFKDINSRYLIVSRSLATRFGMTPAELKGKTDFDLFSQEHARKTFEDEQRIIRSGQPLLDCEERETWPHQPDTWMLTTKMPLRDASGNIVGTFGLSRDITARKRAEQRISEQAAVIDQTPIAILITDFSHRVTYCNAGAAVLYGVPAEKLLGSTAENIFTADTLVQLNEAWLATLVNGRWTGEMPLVTQTGREIQAEFHMSLIYDDSGRVKARLSIAIDITEKKKIEEQFLRAQRLESLGLLAAGIAHDLNNVLSPVLMGAPLLRGKITGRADLHVLETIEHSAVRGAGLVRQILSFAHGTSSKKTLVQIKHLLNEMADFIQETFPKTITLKTEIPNNLWAVRGNPVQIHQVLLNLCVNARDAMPQGGTLTLVAENRTLDGPALQAQPGHGPIPGSYVVLEVSDTGTGIPADVLTRIWDPFFTTKAEGKGTGLGLATVRGIATSHGGFVIVFSEPGSGSRFSVFLPAAEQAIASGLSAVSADPFRTRGQGELVLVVDDEIDIRNLITTILSRFGYRVVAAANGNEAMALYAPREGEIALVVTDLSMPQMGGGNLAIALSRLNPSVKILFMSGANDAGTVGEIIPASAHVLGKPFTGGELLASIRKALAV